MRAKVIFAGGYSTVIKDVDNFDAGDNSVMIRKKSGDTFFIERSSLLYFKFEKEKPKKWQFWRKNR